MSVVRVRVAVAVDDLGQYYAIGASWMTERAAVFNVHSNVKDPHHVFWMEADLPWCQNTVRAEVKKA